MKVPGDQETRAAQAGKRGGATKPMAETTEMRRSGEEEKRKRMDEKESGKVSLRSPARSKHNADSNGRDRERKRDERNEGGGG